MKPLYQKKLLLFFGILFGLPLGTLTAAVLWLQTESGSRFLVAQIKTQLKNQSQIEFDAKTATIRPLSGLSFQDLTLSRDSSHPGGEIKVRIPELRMRYSVALLFSRSFRLEEFLVKDAQIFARLIGPTDPQSPPESSSPLDLAELHRLLLSPPLRLSIDGVQIENVQLDTEIRTSDGQFKVKLPRLDAQMKLSGKPAEWKFHSELKIPSGAGKPQIRAELRDPKTGNPTVLQFSPSGYLQTSLAASQDPSNPDRMKFDQAEGVFDFALKEIQLTLPSSGTPAPRLTQQSFKGKISLATPSEVVLSLESQTDGFHLPGVTRAPLSALNRMQLEIPSDILTDSQRAVKLNSQSFVGNLHSPLLQTQVEISSLFSDRNSASAQFKGQVQTQLEPSLSRYWVGADALQAYPPFQFTADFQGTAQTKASPLVQELELEHFSLKLDSQEFLSGKLNAIQTEGDQSAEGSVHFATASSLQKFFPKETWALLLQPVHADLQFRGHKTADGTIAIDAQGSSPSLHFRDLPEFSKNTFDVAAKLTPDQKFILERCDAKLGDGSLTFNADASGDVLTESLQSKGYFLGNFKAQKGKFAGKSLDGSLSFPWSLVVRRGREIDFEGELGFVKFSAMSGNQAIRGVNGSIPISEKLLYRPEKGRSAMDSIQFAHVLVQNAFERVDYDRFQPFFKNSAPFEIREIQFEEKKYGPFHGYFSVHQNRVAAHQFDLALGTEGRTTGELFLDIRPDHLTFGLLSRLTNLDLGEVIPKSMSQGALPASSQNNLKIAGRTGVVLQLNKSTLEGRMDITQISAPALLTLLHVLDPKHEDEKLNQARFGLGLAHPTFVGMVFNRGSLDLILDMSSPVPSIRVRGIPIASLLATVTSDVLSSLKPE